MDRTNKDLQVSNMSNTWVPEYDLWCLLSKIKDLLPIQVQTQWVKGYQDELGNGKNFGPFQQEVQLNIEMEQSANETRLDSMIITFKRQTYSYTGMSILYDEKGCMINDFQTFLYDKLNGRRMHQYIQEKFNWSDIEQSLIDWRYIEGALKKYSEYKKPR